MYLPYRNSSSSSIAYLSLTGIVCVKKYAVASQGQSLGGEGLYVRCDRGLGVAYGQATAIDVSQLWRRCRFHE